MPEDSTTPESNPQPISPEPAIIPPSPQDPLQSTPTTEATPEVPVSNPSNPSPLAPKKSHRKIPFVILIIIILAAIGVGYALKVHGNNGNGKKDIPYLTYGIQDTGDITPTYPVDSENSSDITLINDQLFEGLVRYQDQIKIQPALATSWTNPNNTTWLFNLRHGVKFHTGRIMTAADVKYSLDYAIAHQSEEGNSTILALADGISKVTIVNPYQVMITTDGPDAVLLNQLAYLNVVDSKAKLGNPNAGTGPYAIKPGSIKPNATTLNLVAFNDYWGGHVYTRAVQFQEYPTPNQLMNAVIAGKIDLTGNGDFTTQQLAEIKAKSAYYRPIVISDLGVTYLELNLERSGSPLQSVTARQAATYALNIPAILKAGGLTGTQVSQVIPQTLPGYDPSIKNTPYNPTKAKQLLATVPDASAPITLKYATGDGGQVNEIAKELSAVGFNVKTVEINDFNTFVVQIGLGQGDIFYLSYDTNTLDGLDMINNTVAGTANYTSPELTSLISQASSTIDPTTRIAILQKMEGLIATDIPTIPLFTQTRTFTLTKPYVVNDNLPGGTDSGVYLYQVYQQ
jgi:peptide/nickel transport system substrate-binding protein